MDAIELAFAGAARQARLVAAAEVSARELVQATLDRIARLDPVLNAFRVVYADRALSEAAQADARRGAGDGDGDSRPMLGVPVAIKDDTDVTGDVTTMGTAAHGPPSRRNAHVVERLRAAGAIIVGKTNVPELTMWPFTETLTFGATRNPWALDRTPGGSSGGSGAAAAAGLCGVALGSDGLGSIRIPAAFCGLFGLKPTRGRVSLGPDNHDCWQGLTVRGPLSRTVADAALFLDVTADGARPEGGFAAAAARPPGRLRVGVSTALPPGVAARLGADQRRAVDQTADVLRSLGHDVREREVDYGPALFGSAIVRYLRGIHDDAAALAYPERLERRTRTMARFGRMLPARAVARARAAEDGIARRMGRVFDDVDVVLLPGPAGPPFRVGTLQHRGALATMTVSEAKVPYHGAWNVVGFPAASVPAGFDRHGLPLSVQLAGPRDADGVLLSLSAQLEATRPWADRRPPVG